MADINFSHNLSQCARGLVRILNRHEIQNVNGLVLFKNIYYCRLKVGETKLLLCPQLFFSNFFVGKINLENNTVIVQKTMLIEVLIVYEEFFEQLNIAS